VLSCRQVAAAGLEQGALQPTVETAQLRTAHVALLLLLLLLLLVLAQAAL
jgi:hypothetical protein